MMRRSLREGKPIPARTRSGDFGKRVKPFNLRVNDRLYPPDRLKYDLEGNSGHLYFECLYVDNATKKIVTHVGVQADLIRANGRWLIKGAKSTPLPQL